MNKENEQQKFKDLQNIEKKAEKWLLEWNKKQNINLLLAEEEGSIASPKKDNFDRLIGCGG